MSDEMCARCGEPARGYARGFDNERLCHEGASPTCYEQDQRDHAVNGKWTTTSKWPNE